MALATRSEPKQKVIEFIKTTTVDPEKPEASYFQFSIYGTEEDAKRFVHRMRVELSRLREVVRQHNRIPREFKMLAERYEFDISRGLTEIQLRRAEGRQEVVDPAVAELFNDIAE